MIDSELEASVRYLESDEALASLAADPYWPKWDSPWWHMLLLHEMGATKRIHERSVHALVQSLDRLPLKIFPIHDGELPEGVPAYRVPCHCQLGTVYQVLSTWGVDVDRELPWIRPWLLRHQMPDGGLNCDDTAYRVEDEVPSSMVGTIGAFEAILLCTDRPWTAAERTFLDHGAQFLIGRRLVEGSSTHHNAEERTSALAWGELCFPRFYFYDVLRGLSALTKWASMTNQPIPRAAHDVAESLLTRFPDGQLRIGRQPWLGKPTWTPTASTTWHRSPSTVSPLLARVSVVGEVSPYLNRQWSEARALLGI